MKLTTTRILAASVVVLCATVTTTAHAGLIVGGSSLLTSGDLTLLESWLGEGPLTLTNIFTKTVGSTPLDFHAAADGKGRTISVMQATDDGVSAIIGGYNPLSWSDIADYNRTFDNAHRTAFLFNFANNTLYPQLLSTPGDDRGLYQTFNWAFCCGPSFGGGFDLGVLGDLTIGYSNLYSYSSGDGSDRGLSLVSGQRYDGINMDVGELEVFTVNADEPSTLPLLGVGLLGICALRCRRSVKHARTQ